MGKIDWKSVTREDVIKAVELFLSENPDYPSPRSTFLVYDGKKLPAKHIRGMAYKVANHVEVSKEDYAGGMDTVRFFERLGFEVYYTGNVPKPTTAISEKKIEVKKSNQIPKPPKPHTSDIKREREKEGIRIPSGRVIEQKNALQLLLNKIYDGDIVCEKTYSWLKTPEDITGPYLQVFNALSNYRGNTDFAKKNVTLRCDFVCEGEKLIIEYDERQHFSEARRVALAAYPEVHVLFDRDKWMKACQDVQARDNAPANRDEVRAYYDSTRDIACYLNGYRLIRIMHGQIDFEKPDALEKLKALLGSKQVKSSVESKKTEQEKEHILDSDKEESLKVALYLQTNELKNQKQFEKVLPKLQEAAADIIVFPEYCYVPFVEEIVKTDIFNSGDQRRIYDLCLDFSRKLGKAVIVSSHDKYDTIFSVFANAFVGEGDSELNLYVKHTMAGSSCLDLEYYNEIAAELFDPISYKGCKTAN